MTRFISLVLTLSLFFAIIGPTAVAQAAPAYYVDPIAGSDTNNGLTLQSAFKTITAARNAVRLVNANMSSDIMVYLNGGTYPQTASLVFSPQDSGTNGHFINYVAISGQTPVISGGQAITGWQPVPGKPYYVASVPVAAGYASYFRQLWVDGQRAQIATQDNPIYANSISHPSAGMTDGVIFNAGDVKAQYTNIQDIRIFHFERAQFKADYLPVLSISAGSAPNTVLFKTQQPFTNIRGERGIFDATTNDLWYIQNAIEELDTPGEWYLDQSSHLVYYYPLPGKSITSSQIVAPVVESLMLLQGDSTKVSNLTFQGITFEFGNWMLPQQYFIGGTQAELLYATNETDQGGSTPYDFQVPGEVVLNQTNNITFTRNVFRYSGCGGLAVYNGADNTLIQGNITYDTTAAGFIIGRGDEIWPAIQNIIPYEEQNGATVVQDNIVADTGADFFQATGISLLNPYKVQVLHNLVFHTAYMAIHSRAGQTGQPQPSYVGSTEYGFNKTVDNNWAPLDDNASLYTFGFNPSTNIHDNYVADAGWSAGVYTDNNSTGVTVQNMVSEADYNMRTGYVQQPPYQNSRTGTYSRNQSTDNDDTTSNNVIVSGSSPQDDVPWPSAAQQIINSSGLESSYADLVGKLPAFISNPVVSSFMSNLAGYINKRLEDADTKWALPGVNVSSLEPSVIAGLQPSADSGGWSGAGLITDGSVVSGEASNPATEAWVQYNFGSSLSDLSFIFQEDNNGSYQASAWKVQQYSASQGTWIDLFPYVASATTNPQLMTIDPSLSTQQIRLYVQNTQTGGKVGLLEFKVVQHFDLIVNPGFESSSLSPWTVYPATSHDVIKISTSHYNSGSQSIYVYNRSSGGDGFSQDVTANLIARGKNLYTLGAFLWLNTTDNANVSLIITDSAGTHSYTSTCSVGSAWTLCSSNQTVTWTGTLHQALFAVNTTNQTTNFWVDGAVLQ